MRRLFISPDWIEIDKIVFPSEFVDRLATLGLRRGDHLIVLDDSGWEHEISLIEMNDGVATAHVVKKTLAAGERRTKISLFQGLLRPDEFEEILRQGTELGLVEFVPMVCARCEVQNPEALVESMFETWQKLIITISEQAKRGRLPRLRPALPFDKAVDRATRRATSLIVWEGTHSQDVWAVLQERPFSICVLAPPSAGFTPEEMDWASRQGVIPMRPPFDPIGGTPPGLLTSQMLLDQLG